MFNRKDSIPKRGRTIHRIAQAVESNSKRLNRKE